MEPVSLDENVKYVKLNRGNFEKRVTVASAGVLIRVGQEFHNAAVGADDVIYLDNGTTTTYESLYDDMINGRTEVWGIEGEYSKLDPEDEYRRVVSYEELLDTVRENELRDDEEEEDEWN